MVYIPWISKLFWQTDEITRKSLLEIKDENCKMHKNRSKTVSKSRNQVEEELNNIRNYSTINNTDTDNTDNTDNNPNIEDKIYNILDENPFI